MNFTNRYLRYGTNSSTEYMDYGSIHSIVSDKLVNVNMGGQKNADGTPFILEAVVVEGDYVPVIGDWVGIEWRSGIPVAIGNGQAGSSSGLVNINDQIKIISTSDVASNVIGSNHIRTDTIEARHIKVGTVQADHISANTIQSQHISANTIEAQMIKSDAIQARHISANTIQAQHISANAIQSNHISANTITSTHISANAITSVAISANTIGAHHIQAGAIVAGSISANAIQSQHISSNVIQAQHISANAIQTQHISANTITGAQIKAGAIQANNISANTITGDKLTANSISGNHILADSIDASKLTVSARQSGLLASYFTFTAGSTNKFLNFKGSRVEDNLNLQWGSGSPSLVGQTDYFSVRLQGMIFAPDAGQYTFHLTPDDGGRLWVDNTLVCDAWSTGSGVAVSGTITLAKDKWYVIRIEGFENTGNSYLKTEWTTPSRAKEVIPAVYLAQSQTIIDGGTILTGSITADQIKVGTITAASGIIGDLAVGTANIQNAAITSAKIGNAEINQAHIASASIGTAQIIDASITNAKISNLDATKITTGFLDADRIQANTITGDKISGNTITGDKIIGNTIDGTKIKAGTITSVQIAAQTITADEISFGAINGDKIRVNSISAEHIATKGLDANVVTVYNPDTGETLIGGGYLRVDGLDVGVVQSDNLIANGLFMTASSGYGLLRDNPTGESILGVNAGLIGAHQVWKYDLVTGEVVAKIDIAGKKPTDIAIDQDDTYAYVTVEGDDTLVQLDISNNLPTGESLKMGKGPGRIKYFGFNMHGLADMKHFFVLNTDETDVNIPDSLTIVDAPPASTDAELYVHHMVPLGNTPYDMIIDDKKWVYITQAGSGDIAVLDCSHHDSTTWRPVGAIPIAAFATDNYHGGLPSQFGFGVVTGGDSAAQYDANAGMSEMANHGGMHSHGGYGTPSGSLKTYEPRGIAQSTDADTLYVVDKANGELVVLDKYGKAPYNALTGRDESQGNTGTVDMGYGTMPGHDMGAMDMGMDHGSMDGNSPASSRMNGITTGGGPRTRHVRYRITVGDSPEHVVVVNGKIFVTLQGTGEIAIIDEQDILDEIAADRAFYTPDWMEMMPMRAVSDFTVRIITVGSRPERMLYNGSGKILVALTGQSQIAVVDVVSEIVTNRLNTGSGPKGMAITNDGNYLYVTNIGGTGELSFIYPNGAYIGDPYVGLEGSVEYQGADFWIPYRSDWVKDASGNVKSSSTVEFRINEPFLNEGGYVRLAATGKDYQEVWIEQDVYNVTNYSNGNNVVNTIAEKLVPASGNKIWYPKNEWLSSPAPSNIKIVSEVSGNIVRTNATGYSLFYSSNARIEFNTAVPSGNWVEADYTCRNNLYFKPHNGSVLIAVENGSSENFNTLFEIDEYVPKFVVLDNKQTAAFTPTADGINQTYSGLFYSVGTNRAIGKTVTTSATPVTAVTTLASYSNKVTASVVANPHIGKTNLATSLIAPGGAGWQEYTQTGYDSIKTIGGSTANRSTSTSGNISQALFSFNLIDEVERKHAITIPGATTANKVDWLKNNVTKFTFNWYGFGFGPSGNKATISSWIVTTSTYGQPQTTTTGSTATKQSITTTIDGTYPLPNRIDNNGFVHFIAYADASNGSFVSSVTTDYVELIIDTKLPALQTNTSYVVDGLQIDDQHGDVTATDNFPSQPYVSLPSGNQYVQVDLGKLYMVGKVTVTHMYETDRIYQGTKTQVSEDGVTWTTVFDSAVSGTYNEKPSYHPVHDHTHYSKVISFDARPVRYVRDYANGWVSGDGTQSGSSNDWTDIKVFADWEYDKSYASFATNGNGIVTTDISKAYVSLDIPVEFTSWWYMTYIVGPEFGTIAIEMPTLMNSNHFLPQYNDYVNKIAHRHIMSFTPSVNVKADEANLIVAGKHRVVIRQESGKISLDRIRVEDFQYYRRNSMLVNDATTTFQRYKLITEQAKWYVGQGIQSTFGAYDTPRTNPDTGLRDYSVPIKYRFRIKSLLNADGTAEERGIAYATSAIMETGKLSTHWRPSAASDLTPASKIALWDSNQPHKTGIQSDHIANGAIRGAKILAGAIMDYHISPYARIEEHKLKLKFPTHQHGHYMMMDMGGGMMMEMFMDNKDTLDSIHGWAGISGNYGTDNTLARGNHKHDDLYLSISGTAVNASKLNNLTSSQFVRSDIAQTLSGAITMTSTLSALSGLNVTGNIVVTGTVDGVDVSTLNTTVTGHIGAGGNAHAVVISSGNAGFMSGADKAKLDGIQVNAISQVTADARYLPITNGVATGLSVITTSGTTPFVIKRTASNTEIVSQYVTDASYNVDYTNDETASEIKWTLSNTDTENATGVSANTGFVRIAQNKTQGTRLYVNTNEVWHAGNLSISNYYQKTETYNRTEIDGMISSSGDIRAGNANTFTNANTFSYGGLALKIQPSANVAANTKIMQINNYQGVELISVDHEGDTIIKGNLVVQGTTQYAGTTVIQGDYTINGALNISGNSVLGDSIADQTTVYGSLILASGGVFKEVGKEVEVMRFPVYGIAGDLQFQTDSTTYEDIMTNYFTFRSDGTNCLPAVPSGATRKFRILVNYSDNISTTNASNLRIVQQGTTTEIVNYVLPKVNGAVNGPTRTWLSPSFTTSFTSHTTFQAKTDVNTASLVIKYIAIIAYDVY